MGGKYSKRVHEAFASLKALENMDIEVLRKKIMTISLETGRFGMYYLTKADVKQHFLRTGDLNEVQVHHVMMVFDYNEIGRISSLDFWGSLVLLSNGSHNDKIKLVFSMMDFNEDGFLGFNDLVTLLICTTRGVAKLRGYNMVPQTLIDRLLVEAFRVNRKVLREDGEIEMTDFRTFLLSDDACKQYISSLGAAVIPVDAAALASKRADLLKEAVIVHTQIAELLSELEEMDESGGAGSSLREDRGGDVKLLQITDEERLEILNELYPPAEEDDGVTFEDPVIITPSASAPVLSSTQPNAMRAASTESATSLGFGSSSMKAQRRSSFTSSGLEASAKVQRNHPALKFLKAPEDVYVDQQLQEEDDAAAAAKQMLRLSADSADSTGGDQVSVAGSTASGSIAVGKKKLNIYSESFKRSLWDLWKRLPHFQDELVAVDPFTLIVLFDTSLGITLSYDDAEQLLNHVPRSQLGRSKFEDVVQSYRIHSDTCGVTKNGENDSWQQFQDQLYSYFETCRSLYSDWMEKLTNQRTVLDAVAHSDNMLKYIDYLRLHRPGAAVDSSGATGGSSNGSTANDKNFIMKLVQFRNLSSRRPSTIQTKHFFNNPHRSIVRLNDDASSVVSGATALRGQSRSSRQRSRGKANSVEIAADDNEPRDEHGDPLVSEEERVPLYKTVKLEDLRDWKLSFKFTITANPFTNLSTKRPKESSRVKNKDGFMFIEDFSNLQALDMLDFYNLLQEKQQAERLEYERLMRHIRAAEASGRTSPSSPKSPVSGRHSPHATTATPRRSSIRTPRRRSVNSAASQSSNADQTFVFPYSHSNTDSKKDSSAAEREDSAASTAELKEFKSAIWLCFELRNGLAIEQELIVVHALRNYFNAIPLHLREDIYTDVFVEVFPILKSGIGTGSKASDALANMMQQLVEVNREEKRAATMSASLDDISSAESSTASAGEHNPFNVKKVVLVGLYHERDFFLEIERKLIENDLFISRTLTSTCLEVNLMQTFQEILDQAQRFAYYGDKLFGPQEEEIENGESDIGMNPLKFAKAMRAKRRGYEEIATAADMMNRHELARKCREIGIRDIGTPEELRKRVRAAYMLQADLTGFGELSQFGREIVTKIFHMYKRERIERSIEDGGLTVWELNELLLQAGAHTLYDAIEGKSFIEESQVLTDREQRIRLAGLQAFYRDNGRLKLENDAIGVGSLNEQLSGRITFNSTFEPDALGSILSLVGQNAVNVPAFVRYVALFSALKDVKLEGEVNSISELLEFLDIKSLVDTSASIFRNPGWLARSIDEFSSFLADGSGGIIPALRQYLSQHFGRYDNFEQSFSSVPKQVVRAHAADEELQEMRQLLRSAEENAKEAKDLAKQEKREMAADRAEAVANATKTQGALQALNIESLSPRAANIVKVEKPRKLAQPQGGSHETAAKEFAAQMEHLKTDIENRERQLTDEVIRRVLPPLQSYEADGEDTVEGKNGDESKRSSPMINIQKTIVQMKEDLIFLNEVRGMKSVKLTLEQSNRIVERKEFLQRNIERLAVQQQQDEALFAATSCALYDALRLYCKGLSNIGFGSEDFCVRGYADGLNCFHLLPPGLGEDCPPKRKQKQRESAARERKAASIAALERERLRRNMTEEEKEALMAAKLRVLMAEWAKEEAKLFQEAFSALCECRDSAPNMARTNAMLKRWEELIKVKESRYPEDISTAVAKNNYACLLIEFYTLDHPKGSPAQYILDEAAQIMMIGAEDPERRYRSGKEGVDVGDTTNASEREATPAGGRGEKKKKKLKLPPEERELSPHELDVCGTCISKHSMIAGCVLMISNFIATLMQTESVGHMQRSLEIKIQAYLLFRLLTEEEQQLLLNSATVPVIKDMVVFNFSPHYNTALQAIIEEISYYLDDGYVSNAREEERKRLLAEEEAAEQKKKEALEAEERRIAAMTPAQRRQEKRRKFEEQRRRDNALRAETSRQRKILYELIHTDQISHVFEAEAKGSMKAAENPEWGKEHDQQFKDAQDAMRMLSASYNQRHDLLLDTSGAAPNASLDTFEENPDGSTVDSGVDSAVMPHLTSSISSLSGGVIDESSRTMER